MTRRAARGLTRADAAYLRSAFGAVPYGVTAVGAIVDGRPVGLAVSSFTAAGVHDIVVLRLRAIEVDHCVTPLVSTAAGSGSSRGDSTTGAKLCPRTTWTSPTRR